jgi:uncharacterized protein
MTAVHCGLSDAANYDCMSQHYLDAVHQGKNEWWRYLLGVLLILGGGFIIGSIFVTIVGMVLLLASNPDPTIFTDPQQLEPALLNLLNQPTIANFVVQNLQFVVLMLGIALAVKLVHGRRFRTLISPDASLSWRRCLTGFGLWFGLLAVVVGVSEAIAPSDLTLTFQPLRWLGLLVAVLILTPIQIGAEELFCRGYLMQGLGLLTRNRLLLVGLPSMLFASAHFANPEMARGAVWMALQYWALGVFLATLTLRDDRLELALGIHAAQNMFTLLIINSADSVLKTPSIWTTKDVGDPRLSLIVLLAQMALFYWLIFGRKKPRHLAG